MAKTSSVTATAIAPPEAPTSVASAAAPSPTPVMPEGAPAPQPVTITKTVTLPEQDAYILERVHGQPESLDVVRATVINLDSERTRLSLPEYFERQAYDCSVGKGCKAHQWKLDEAKNRWGYTHHGEFIFRWVWKDKRAMDRALNAFGWFIVNAKYFPDAPTHLFSANGGIEEGDMLLCFLPAKAALALRNAPGQRSTDMIRSRMTRTPKGAVVMTGNPDSDRYYVPESSGAEEEDATAPGLQEGRDF